MYTRIEMCIQVGSDYNNIILIYIQIRIKGLSESHKQINDLLPYLIDWTRFG